MPITAAIGAGIGAAGSIGSSLISSNASKNASNAQAATANAALNNTNALFQKGLDLVQPFVDYGKSAGSTLLSLLTPGPNQTNVLSQLPGFQFAQDWGQKAITNLGSTLGFGGNTLKAGADYATGVAQQGFGTIVNALQALTNTGSSAAGSAFGNATQTGANTAATYGTLGNAQASGILGSANALSGGLTGGANSITNAMVLNRLFNGSGSGMYGGSRSNPLPGLSASDYGVENVGEE